MSTIEPVMPVEPALVRRAIAEAVGMFILVFLGCGAAVSLTTASGAQAASLQFTGIALGFGLGIAGAVAGAFTHQAVRPDRV